VSQIGKWPPSKDVAYALDPDFTGPADTDGTTLPGDSGATDTANECGATGGVAIDSTGFAFPLITTQAALIKYGWCYKSLTNCHHDYNAADIFDTEGVQVVAAKPGTVVNATEVATCNGGYNVPRIMIKDEDGIYYYYTHLKPGSLTVKDGSSVVAGTVLGKIGPTECAQYTPTHLHFQMSSVPITNTESASEKTKYINPQPNLVSSFANLPKNVGDVGVAAAGSIDPEALKPSPCAPGTKDAGQAEGWYSGQRYSITLCSIPNLPSVGDEDRPAGGLARVNAAFSGDVLKLVTAAKAAGKTAIAESSFRTMAFQTRQYDGCTGSCVKGTTVKKPGYSIHQIGGAIDFDVHCGIDSNISGRSNPKCPLSNSRSVSPDDSMWEWLEAHAGGYGFKPYSAEAWHWSKTGE
jgi:hypothetical protein